MFGDLKRFDTGASPGLDWFRSWLDDIVQEGAAADIRSVPHGSFPMINVGRTDDAIHVYVLAAGLAVDDLEVSVQDNVLTLRGRRDALPSVDDEGKRSCFRRERFDGEFVRSIGLPEGIDVDRAEARFRDGVFEIHLPKREELRPRRIEIQAA